RRARRIAWRAWRSASAVTAQVLRIIALRSPATAAARRMTSLSNALRRHPKVMISTSGIASTHQQRGVDAALEGERRRPGHNHIPIIAPPDVEIAAVERDRCVTSGQPPTRGGDQRGAGAAAAGLGDPGAAPPDAPPDPLGAEHRHDPDIGPVREKK